MIREVHISRGTRAVLIGFAVVSAVLFLSVVVFVMRVELAFRDSRCPFHPVGERDVGTLGRMEEEARRCLPGVEEHRWTLVSAAGERRIFGQRRLDSKFFSAAAYRWRVDAHSARGLALTVENDGTEKAVFYERPPKRGER